MMSDIPNHTRSFSLQLSKVLDDIGVSDATVRKRREIMLANETIKIIQQKMLGKEVTIYSFGSQTEGTTAIGLNSDTDTLVSDNRFNIIQDLAEWRVGYKNVLMVHDPNTPPGYCLLQETYDNYPSPVVHIQTGRDLLRNDWFVDRMPAGTVRHGPSLSTRGLQGLNDDDIVHAYYCKSWPKEARQWINTTRPGYWPPEELKRQAMNDGCFVVPVGLHGTENEDFQWRISTSLTERRLMFSLNIVQIRCYVLMKMILKSYQTLVSEDALSSFICKTVLLHCIEREGENLWQDDNLLNCLNICLKFLHDCVLLEHCPHFIIRENNLMARRIPPDIKPQILTTIQYILDSDGNALNEIQIDQLGMRLSLIQFENAHHTNISEVDLPAPTMTQSVSEHLLYNFMLGLSARIKGIISTLTDYKTETVVQTLSQYIDKLVSNYPEGDDTAKTACTVLSSFLYMSHGSVLASRCISRNEPITENILLILEQGSMTDFSCSLKQASVFYCKGDIPQTKSILDQTDQQYSIEHLQSVCGCYQSPDRERRKHEFQEVCHEGDIKHVLKHTAFCVRFLPCEVNCVPEELKHEYFRTASGMHHSREQHDDWMDWAVVDSIPYFYFLQYKVFSHQGNRERKLMAVNKLRQAIATEPNLGHKETALNLLAQCLEQEYALDDALHCYNASINHRTNHNAAYSLISNIAY
ncbi:uncharacterized protein LOC132715233 [Ruditapes philippinarum]|uniref:uncharacterized protein LOC132715233 n=1 Tax=Ruditapes philippinarum TaxID=129788 RepID=UPI00295AFCAC|nr:uncharacterized protein LOC132715233 [Ruditapes philippinarum]